MLAPSPFPGHHEHMSPLFLAVDTQLAMLALAWIVVGLALLGWGKLALGRSQRGGMVALILGIFLVGVGAAAGMASLI